MEITICNNIKGICRIRVAGELESMKDELHFLEILEAQGCRSIYIDFLDANILGSMTVHKLQQLQQRNCARILVHKAYLLSYLHNLGIQSSYIANRYSSNSIEEDLGISPEDTIKFLEDIKQHYGYDYTQYQLESIIRRIKVCMLKGCFKSFKLFREEVLRNEQLFEQLFLYFSINTTEFFRNPEVFRELLDKVMPYLDTYPHIKIWCAGCSTGQEPYSLAMLLKEKKILDKTQIYATDINPYAIREAKNGLYSLKSLENNICNYRNAGGSGSFMDYFTIKGDYLEIDENLKKHIFFFQHSLQGSGVLNQFQLIICRNVLIYFTPELQKKVLRVFANSLDRNGFLLLGKSEGILHNGGSECFFDYSKENKIYKKKESYNLEE